MSAFKPYSHLFDDITGSSPDLELLLQKDYSFAHEAGVFIPETDQLFITSNRLLDQDGQPYAQISKISLGKNRKEQSPRCDVLDVKDIAMGNGGTNWGNTILFCAQGGMISPSGLFSMEVSAPYQVRLLVKDFLGRPFNSVNDVVVKRDGSIWFTDPTYGYEQGYRPPPLLPSQVYRFDPSTRAIRAVADGFGHPNGLCFSPDESIMYITDTDRVNGTGTKNDTKASTM